MIPRTLLWAMPLAGILAVVAVPVVRSVQKSRAESIAAEFLQHVRAAQRTFTGSTDMRYASSLESLTAPCPAASMPILGASALSALTAAGYDARVRAAEGAVPRGSDCHGRPTVSDYYAAAFPRAVGSAGQQAFATTAAGRIFVFFDGIAPLERDMHPNGLATPLESLDAFRIP